MKPVGESVRTPPQEKQKKVLSFRYKERTILETSGFPLAKTIRSSRFNQYKGIESNIRNKH